MTWWRWTRRCEPPSDDELRQRSERLRAKLLETTAELDGFVAALNAEVGRRQNLGRDL